MTENGKTRRWVIAGVVLSAVGVLGPDGPWRSLLWGRRPSPVHLKLDLMAEGSGSVNLKADPISVTVTSGVPRIEVTVVNT